MLTATFLHAQGIGPTAEKKLWDAGFLSWESVLGAESGLPLSDAQKQQLLPTIAASAEALARGDSHFLAQSIPSREHWRAAPTYKNSVAFLDIETTGGYDADDITIIGVYDGFESRIYVKGVDLEAFETDIKQYDLLVTFFGGGFDLPFLRRRFPKLLLDGLHIDLCPALRRLGYSGGLKAIERKLKITRTDEVEGMSGMDAVYLWSLYQRRGDKEALERLIAYNKADIENLALLLAFTYPRLAAATGFPG
jgi:uncharacterized protein